MRNREGGASVFSGKHVPCASTTSMHIKHSFAFSSSAAGANGLGAGAAVQSFCRWVFSVLVWGCCRDGCPVVVALFCQALWLVPAAAAETPVTRLAPGTLGAV